MFRLKWKGHGIELATIHSLFFPKPIHYIFMNPHWIFYVDEKTLYNWFQMDYWEPKTNIKINDLFISDNNSMSNSIFLNFYMKKFLPYLDLTSFDLKFWFQITHSCVCQVFRSFLIHSQALLTRTEWRKEESKTNNYSIISDQLKMTMTCVLRESNRSNVISLYTDPVSDFFFDLILAPLKILHLFQWTSIFENSIDWKLLIICVYGSWPYLYQLSIEFHMNSIAFVKKSMKLWHSIEHFHYFKYFHFFWKENIFLFLNAL